MSSDDSSGSSQHHKKQRLSQGKSPPLGNAGNNKNSVAEVDTTAASSASIRKRIKRKRKNCRSQFRHEAMEIIKLGNNVSSSLCKSKEPYVSKITAEKKSQESVIQLSNNNNINVNNNNNNNSHTKNNNNVDLNRNDLSQPSTHYNPRVEPPPPVYINSSSSSTTTSSSTYIYSRPQTYPPANPNLNSTQIQMVGGHVLPQMVPERRISRDGVIRSPPQSHQSVIQGPRDPAQLQENGTHVQKDPRVYSKEKLVQPNENLAYMNEKVQHLNDNALHSKERSVHPSENMVHGKKLVRVPQPNDRLLHSSETTIHSNGSSGQKMVHPNENVYVGEKTLHPNQKPLIRASEKTADPNRNQSEKLVHPNEKVDLSMVVNRIKKVVHLNETLLHLNKKMHASEKMVCRNEEALPPNEKTHVPPRLFHSNDTIRSNENAHHTLERLLHTNDKMVYVNERAPNTNGRTISQNEKTSHLNERLLHPSERLPHPNERLPHPNERLPHPNERLPHPNERLPHPNERLPHPNERLPHPNERVLHSNERLLEPNERVLHPNERVLHPNERLIHSNERLLNPNERLLYPNERIPHASERVSHPSERTPYLNDRITSPNERKLHSNEKSHYPNERILHPNVDKAQEMPHQNKIPYVKDRPAIAPQNQRPLVVPAPPAKRPHLDEMAFQKALDAMTQMNLIRREQLLSRTAAPKHYPADVAAIDLTLPHASYHLKKCSERLPREIPAKHHCGQCTQEYRPANKTFNNYFRPQEAPPRDAPKAPEISKVVTIPGEPQPVNSLQSSNLNNRPPIIMDHGRNPNLVPAKRGRPALAKVPQTPVQKNPVGRPRKEKPLVASNNKEPKNFIEERQRIMTNRPREVIDLTLSEEHARRSVLEDLRRNGAAGRTLEEILLQKKTDPDKKRAPKTFMIKDLISNGMPKDSPPPRFAPIVISPPQHHQSIDRRQSIDTLSSSSSTSSNTEVNGHFLESNAFIPHGKLRYDKAAHSLCRYFEEDQKRLFLKATINSPNAHELCQNSEHVIPLPRHILFNPNENLTVEEYVREMTMVESLDKIPDFYQFYKFVTGYQICNNKTPVSFLTFLSIYNTDGLKRLLDRYVSSAMRRSV